jgi:hypothetical protein
MYKFVRMYLRIEIQSVQTEHFKLYFKYIGASGEVWKVRNKLDRRLYAVKKISMGTKDRESGLDRKIRREVTTVSRLLHKHIVRYFAAWVEEIVSEKVATVSNNSSQNSIQIKVEESTEHGDSDNDDSDTSVSSVDSSSSDSSIETNPPKNFTAFSKFYHPSTPTLHSDNENSDEPENMLYSSFNSLKEDELGFEYLLSPTCSDGNLDFNEKEGKYINVYLFEQIYGYVNTNLIPVFMICKKT